MAGARQGSTTQPRLRRRDRRVDHVSVADSVVRDRGRTGSRRLLEQRRRTVRPRRHRRRRQE